MEHEIAAWLGSLGLEKYSEAFRANDIDVRALRHLNEEDLRELGISLGHRKVLLAAIAELKELALSDARTATSVQGLQPGLPSPTDPAERRLVSILFCDLVGSTALARRLDPEDMRVLLRSYQDRVAGAVTRYGGHVAQYLGDGVMAFFGWPRAYEDQAERAVRAGLEALAAVQALEAPGGGRSQARAAIGSGRVVVGDLSGSAGRRDRRRDAQSRRPA